MSENSSSKIPAASSQMGGTVEPQDFVDRGAPLPEGYGETRIVLLTRDPHWMYTYWEITDQTARDLKSRFGEDIFWVSQATLRMHEVEDSTGRSVRFVDVSISLEAKNWYLRADRERSSWFVELGLKTKEGNFIAIVRSNIVRLPSARVSDQLDEKWVTFREDLEKILQASGGGQLGMGSLELARMISQRWELLSQISSWRGSGGVSSFGGPTNFPEEKVRGFWLVADCELVLYGATETDATLTVAGRPVELNPDGTFSLRFALPDGKLELPVRAISGDRVEVREIKITVDRNTQK